MIPFLFDPTYLLVIPALIFSMYAQFKVSSTYAKYSAQRSSKGYTGADVAKHLLMSSGITDVDVTQVPGNLTDHYDPRSNVIRLSDSVYGKTSVAALAVAAHETGHAIQHHLGYFPLNIRTAIFPVVNIGSQAAPILFIIGMLLRSPLFMQLGIIFFSVYVIFSLVTLPVEFNASSRAIRILSENNFLTEEEIVPARKVLSAAALTYVAGALMALLQLLRLLLLSRNRD